jgi:elongation factor P--beta-lysine ligase
LGHGLPEQQRRQQRHMYISRCRSEPLAQALLALPRLVVLDLSDCALGVDRLRVLATAQRHSSCRR